ncbi:MAG: hypothetical protein PHI98_09080 [Eubacteriales bacterium]|nr:hypothetical protein [Eubacteriales bacterium]
MLKYGPTGALSEYYYKNGVFHGVHYGDFHQDCSALFELIDQEEAFLLQTDAKRRILFDLYHTDLSSEVLEYLMMHLSHISSRIYKIAFAAQPKELRKLKRAIRKAKPISLELCMFGTDQNEDKTWLVS